MEYSMKEYLDSLEHLIDLERCYGNANIMKKPLQIAISVIDDLINELQEETK